MDRCCPQDSGKDPAHTTAESSWLLLWAWHRVLNHASAKQVFIFLFFLPWGILNPVSQENHQGSI